MLVVVSVVTKWFFVIMAEVSDPEKRRGAAGRKSQQSRRKRTNNRVQIHRKIDIYIYMIDSWSWFNRVLRSSTLVKGEVLGYVTLVKGEVLRACTLYVMLLQRKTFPNWDQ